MKDKSKGDFFSRLTKTVSNLGSLKKTVSDLGITLHTDGISIKKFSFRLSNIPENLGYIAKYINSVSPQVLILYALATAGKITAESCSSSDPNPVYKYSSLYLEQFNASFLWILYTSDLLMGDINNTCDFTISQKERVQYDQLNCLCPITDPPPMSVANGSLSESFVYHRVILSGHNINQTSLTCMEQYLSHCKSIPPSPSDWFKLGLVLGIIFVVIPSGIMTYKKYCSNDGAQNPGTQNPRAQNQASLVLNNEEPHWVGERDEILLTPLSSSIDSERTSPTP